MKRGGGDLCMLRSADTHNTKETVSKPEKVTNIRNTKMDKERA